VEKAVVSRRKALLGFTFADNVYRIGAQVSVTDSRVGYGTGSTVSMIEKLLPQQDDKKVSPELAAKRSYIKSRSWLAFLLEAR